MIIKKLDYNCYTLQRAEKNWSYIESEENIITVKMIKDAVNSIKTLVNTDKITVRIVGMFDDEKSQESYSFQYDGKEIEKINNNTIEFIENDKLVKIKVNVIEHFEAIPDLELEEKTYYHNMIDRVNIEFKQNN